MIVYSVGSRQSFEMVRNIREKILNHLVSMRRMAFPSMKLITRHQGADEVPIMIVGNKCDIKKELRKVSPQEGEALAKELKCGWTEASARDNENVALSFELMIAQIERSQNPNEPTGGNKCTIM
jgi:Ras homolog enriched in brain